MPDRHAQRVPSASPERAFRVSADDTVLDGNLAVPTGVVGVVAFAHGSGSSRFSPRNRHVAAALQARGLATLLLDLLTPEEEALDDRTRELRFDVGLLAHRMVAAIDALAESAATRSLPIGLFGASTGAAAALLAAADRPAAVGAVVSRGGRPDLALERLSEVRAPTLLIVGARDTPVIAMNRAALATLTCPKALELISGATHLFAEPGALEEVARLAGAWFLHHLPDDPA